MSTQSTYRPKKRRSPTHKKDSSNPSCKNSDSIFSELYKREKLAFKRRVFGFKYKHGETLEKILILLGGILAVVCLVGGGLYCLIKTGEASVLNTSQVGSFSSDETANILDDGNTIASEGQVYEINQNVMSICLICFDSLEAGVDETYTVYAVTVLSIDTETGQTTAISIPASCLTLYTDGQTSTEEACCAVLESVSEILDIINVSYYYAIDVSGLCDLNSALGGVVLIPLETIPNTTITEGRAILLSAETALSYLQWYDSDSETGMSDLQDRQIHYLKSFIEQAFDISPGNFSTILNLYNTSQDCAVSNIDFTEISYLASVFIESQTSDIDTIVVSCVDNQVDQAALSETMLSVYCKPL